MIYEQFLLSQLLRDYFLDYNDIAYDELFNISQDIYNNDYINSKYDDPKKDLYFCIEKYIENNKDNLFKKIEHLI